MFLTNEYHMSRPSGRQVPAAMILIISGKGLRGHHRRMFSPHVFPVQPGAQDDHAPHPVGAVSPIAHINDSESDRFDPAEVEEEEPRPTTGGWMRKLVVTVNIDESLGEFARILDACQISGAPVTNEQGKIVGVVSQNDLARHLAKVKNQEPRASSGFYQGVFCNSLFSDPGLRGLLEEGHVRDILTPHSYWVTTEASLEEIVDLMLEKEIHRVPVLEEGALVGMVTTLDVLRHLRRSSEGLSAFRRR